MVQLGLPFDHPVAPFTTPIVPRQQPPSPLSSRDILYRRHRQARRYVLRVDSEGRVRVTIPRGGSRKEAESFARRHLTWIARQRARLMSSAMRGEAGQAARLRATTELPQRLRALAAEHGLHVTRVSVRNQRTRWGSCGPDGHICLNWRLVLMPEWVRDYVLVHELMHLRWLDHSPRFWRLVAAACPWYQEARRWLRLHGTSLR